MAPHQQTGEAAEEDGSDADGSDSSDDENEDEDDAGAAGARGGGQGRRGTRRQPRATMVAGGHGVGMSARKIHLGRLEKYAAEVGVG